MCRERHLRKSVARFLERGIGNEIAAAFTLMNNDVSLLTKRNMRRGCNGLIRGLEDRAFCF